MVFLYRYVFIYKYKNLYNKFLESFTLMEPIIYNKTVLQNLLPYNYFTLFAFDNREKRETIVRQ